jgi:hypothetical protein
MVDDGGSNDTESVDLSDRRVWEVYVSRYCWNPPQVADVGGRAGLGSVRGLAALAAYLALSPRAHHHPQQVPSLTKPLKTKQRLEPKRRKRLEPKTTEQRATTNT